MKTPSMIVTLAALFVSGCAIWGPEQLPQTATAAKPAYSQAEAPVDPAAQNVLYLDLIDGLVKGRRYSAGLAFLDEYALRIQSPEPRYWVLRGDALLGLGRDREALKAFVRLDDTALSAEGWNGRGRVAAFTQSWRAAETAFLKAVEKGPSNAQFLNNLAYARMRMGNASSSLALLRQAHEISPKSDVIRNNLIIALELSGLNAEADRVLAEIPSGQEQDRVKSYIKRTISGDSWTKGEIL